MSKGKGREKEVNVATATLIREALTLLAILAIIVGLLIRIDPLIGLVVGVISIIVFLDYFAYRAQEVE